MKIRELYYKTVVKMLDNGIPLEVLYPTLLENLNDQEKRRLINLINQFFRNFNFVEKILIEKIDKKIDNQHFKTAMLLLAAGVEWLFLDKSAGYAIVNDYVEISKRALNPFKAKYVNAILRKMTSLDKSTLDINSNESLYSSHPEWIINKFKADFGGKTAREILKFNQTIPQVYLRVNGTKTTVAKLKEKLKIQNEVVVEQLENFKDFAVVKSGNPINTSAFEEGEYYIQDPANSIPVLLLNPKKNEKILDLCCAPGGKSTYMQEITFNKVKLFLNDISQKKRMSIKTNFKRLGLRFEKLTFEEAQKFKSFDEFDKILIDAPCSGSGNFRRHPESRWNKDEESLETLNRLQFSILDRAKIYVKKGGCIIYSTCSIFNDENMDIVNKFLAENDDFSLEKSNRTDQMLTKFEYEKGGYLANPAIQQMEGSFAARLVRVK